MTKTGDTNDEAFLQVKYFKKDDAKDQNTWGFAGVAGMEDLKKELRESFIKPLKFKFLVEKLEKESKENPTEKEKLHQQIYEAYKKFNVSIPTGLLFY
ncbi:MAG: hypothetical protein LBC61_03505 [Candidatus Peribacteria bacterium]|jgi:hypothetical protein|nr:hypothetical protein [Candidatus Peribacteria bacterium]